MPTNSEGKKCFLCTLLLDSEFGEFSNIIKDLAKKHECSQRQKCDFCGKNSFHIGREEEEEENVEKVVPNSELNESRFDAKVQLNESHISQL